MGSQLKGGQRWQAGTARSTCDPDQRYYCRLGRSASESSLSPEEAIAFPESDDILYFREFLLKRANK